MMNICHICLFTDIQLETLEEPLNSFHDELCDFGVDQDALSCCPKCMHLLRKFYNFRNKCRNANIVLKKWLKQSKLKKGPINKLHAIFPTSIGLSKDNNHAVFSYKAKSEADDTENDIDIRLTTTADICHDDLINFKPGFVILDSTCPAYNKDAKFIKTTDLISEENEEAENNADKTYLDIFSNKPILETDSKKDKKVTRSRVKNLNKSVHKINLSDVNSKDNLETESFGHKTNVQKEFRDKEVEKSKVTGKVEATVKIELLDDDKIELEDDKIELNDDKGNVILDELAIVEEELKIEQNNDYDDDILSDDVLNDDDINDSDQDIDNDAINSEVIKTCGGNDDVDFNLATLLKEALNSDSSDDEVLQKKKKKVISSCEKTEAKKKEGVAKKRKCNDIDLDDLEFTEDEPKQKKPRWKPITEYNMEVIKKDVIRRIGNGDVTDKEGNIIDMDVILNHLEIMEKQWCNKIIRYCAGNEPLTSDAIDFLARTVKRYGNQYSSIFITKHLTTDEQIMEEFKKRETNQNYVQCEHKCTICYRYFRYAKMLTQHIAEYHDPNKAFKCKYCGIRFSQGKHLRKHLLAHKVEYQCKLCPFVTNHTHVMKTHYNIHKGVRYPCTKCDADFKNPPRLAAHMNSVHESDHIICPYCARNFHSEKGLYHHKLKKHSNEINTVGPPSAKCDECNVQFISDEVYDYHQRNRHSGRKKTSAGVGISKKRKPDRQTGKKTYRVTCRVCKHVESSMGALIWHFKSQHPNEVFDRKAIALRDPYKFLCHECGKGFSMITSYTDHKNVHTGARPYTCTECPKAFYCRSYLRNHLRFHAPPKKECPQCGKKFHSSANLSSHMRQHTGDRRYSCKMCGKTFLHQGSVNEHVRGVHLHIRRRKKPAKQHSSSSSSSST